MAFMKVIVNRINSLRKTSSMLSFLLIFIPLYSGFPSSSYGIQSNTAKSEKRILPEDPHRDKNLLLLTRNDKLISEIIREHSLIAGSKIVMVSRRAVYAWLVENIKVSAALSRIYGWKYQVSPSSVYEYHGDDGAGLSIDFYIAYRDSTKTILAGKGTIKLFHITFTGSFINFMEYNNSDTIHLTAQDCMYVKVNNPVARFITRIAFAISDLEQGIMEKLFSLDDTVFKIVKTLMEDPNLYQMLLNPYSIPPGDASVLAVKMRDAVIGESSPEAARELGTLIERARIETGFQKLEAR
jgi:hypothetical protein